MGDSDLFAQSIQLALHHGWALAGTTEIGGEVFQSLSRYCPSECRFFFIYIRSSNGRAFSVCPHLQ